MCNIRAFFDCHLKMNTQASKMCKHAWISLYNSSKDSSNGCPLPVGLLEPWRDPWTKTSTLQRMRQACSQQQPHPLPTQPQMTHTHTQLPLLTVLNDGRLTRINKQTGSMSNPNDTLAGRTLANRCRWEVCKQLAYSDHLPIRTTIQEGTVLQPVLSKEA